MKYLSIILVMIMFLFSGCARIPAGKQGKEADQLARKVMKATGQQHWGEANVIKWNFDDNHDHIWDRERNLIKVSWDDVEVIESLDTKKGKVWLKGELYEGEKKEKYLIKAYDYWVNDSYWLNPFWKFFEDGVERKIVDYKGKTALLITHTTGGNTPGDSFLWLLDDNGLPYAWKLWVKIIPVKGFKISWESWITLPNGLKISTLHESIFNKISIKNVETGNSIADVFGDNDPFRNLKSQIGD